LPAEGTAVPVQLVITPRANGEEWHRSFAGQPFVSWQWMRPDGLLAERVVFLELRFQLVIVNGTLLYRQQRAAFCFGPLCLPLPGCFSPQVDAWEKPADDGVQTCVSVEVHLPLFGRLITYEGTIGRHKAEPCSRP
jgi:hypothetical protein